MRKEVSSVQQICANLLEQKIQQEQPYQKGKYPNLIGSQKFLHILVHDIGSSKSRN